jgi:L-alanine-DL-glutamate epimerase-like enolase superfamily enzyme
LKYGDAAVVARNAAEAVERGYRHVKLHEITVAEVNAARDAIGDDIELTVDTNCPWSVDEAVAMGRQFHRFSLKWLEEPIWPPENFAGLRQVGTETGVPIAAGENAATLDDFRQLIDDAQVDYLQPSVTKIGGLTAMREVLALARSRGVTVAPHSPYFGPGLIAALHVCAALPPNTQCERFYCDLDSSPFGHQVVAKDGYMRVPQGPGLGIEMDHSVLERYRTG